VLVSTGSEARPPGATIVLWVDTRGDGAARPDNMGDTDLWFTSDVPVSGGDTTAPTAPTALGSSAITSSGFTLSWTASTDDVGVTGYQVRVNGGTPIPVASGTSQAITGLAPSTSYDAQARARDAAGNWSVWSSVLTVSTTAGGFPTPTTLFNFTEGTGLNTVSTNGLRTLTTGSSSGWADAQHIQKQFGGHVDDAALGSLSTWSLSAVINVASEVVSGDASFLDSVGTFFLNRLADGRLRLYPSGGGATTTSTATMSLGTDHRVTIVSDGTTVKVYLDAVEVISLTFALPLIRANNTNVLAAVSGSDMVATMDLLAYWNVALTPTQVAAL